MIQELFKKDLYMLDIETNGLSPITNGMTSFCLLKFNPLCENIKDLVHVYQTGRINSAINIDMCRVVDMKTTKFRQEKGIDDAELKLRRIDSLTELGLSISEMLNMYASLNQRHIFALHTEFDIAFLRGYFEAAGLEFPFIHRNIWEIASMVRGMNLNYQDMRDDLHENAEWLSFRKQPLLNSLNPHSALYDCVEQAAVLRLAAMYSGVF